MSSSNRGGYREGAGRKSNVLAKSSRKMRSLRATDKEWEVISHMSTIVKSDILGGIRMLDRYKDSSGLMWLQILYCSQQDIQPELEVLYRAEVQKSGERINEPRTVKYRKMDMDKENLSILKNLSDNEYIDMRETKDGMYCLAITKKGINYLVDDLRFLHRDPLLMGKIVQDIQKINS